MIFPFFDSTFYLRKRALKQNNVQVTTRVFRTVVYLTILKIKCSYAKYVYSLYQGASSIVLDQNTGGLVF